MELTSNPIGPHQIQDEIGRGRDVVVFRGYDTLYDRDVAIKILPPYLTQDRNSVRRFVTEGREATRLRHVHIVEVYDAGQVDGYVYVAQQLAEGGTLAERLDGQESIIVPRGSFAPHLTPANFIRPRQDKTFLSGYSEDLRW